MSFLPQIIAWINVPANAVGKYILAPVGMLPGWLSNTLVSAVAGVFLLAVFKYTSNQAAIGRIRDKIKANMLALRLFKDSMAVTLQSQARIFKGSFYLLAYSVMPLLVMILPVCMLLAHLGLYYQARPLQPGEEAIVTMTLNSEQHLQGLDVSIEKIDPAAEIILGPVRAFSKRQIHWKIKARENGYHRIFFRVNDRQFTKELAIGNGFMRVSPERPGWHWADILLYPWEKPFRPGSMVQSINIDYPERESLTSGTDWWIAYFFVVSLIFALIFKPVLRVRI